MYSNKIIIRILISFFLTSGCSNEELRRLAEAFGGGDDAPRASAPSANESVSCFEIRYETLFSYDSKDGCSRDVVIPNGITNINERAFYNNQLTSVTIPNNVTSIGVQAFSVNKLRSVIIPNSVDSMGMGAFSGNQLASITISNSLTYIPNAAFYANKLTSITIPNSVTKIESYAFSYNKLTSVTIPSSVTSIEENAFTLQWDGPDLNNSLATACIRADSASISVHANAFPGGTTITYNCTL